MCARTVLAIFLSYVTIRTGSTFAAAIGHGAANGTTNGVTLFSFRAATPSWGPCARASWSGLPLLAVAAIMLWDMRRREKGRHPVHARKRASPTACAPPAARGARSQWRSAFFPDGVYWARDEIKERRASDDGPCCVGAGGAGRAMGRYRHGAHPLGSELPLVTLLINFTGRWP